ncbi:MAG: malonate decarboxylase subunit alpha, partial [Candidatus Sulfotelmatobacter sp.]
MPHPPAHTETSTRSCGARRCQSLGHEYLCQSLWKQLPFTTVVVQVNQIVDKLPRIDIPASWIDVVVKADRPFAIEPLFTRDP